jgi:hypothetical protein
MIQPGQYLRFRRPTKLVPVLTSATGGAPSPAKAASAPNRSLLATVRPTASPLRWRLVAVPVTRWGPVRVTCR